MRKNTQWLIAIIILTCSLNSNAQFGCGSAISITNGYTASGIVTDGMQDWNNNPTNSCVNAAYFSGDVYMLQYTATDFEELSITIFNRTANAAAGFYTSCSGTDFGACIGGSVLTTNGSSSFTSSMLTPSQTVYIAIGTFSGGLDFDITSFSVNTITCPAPSGLSVLDSSTSTATLTWNQGNSETAWEYIVQPQGTGTPTGSGTTASSTTETAINLNAATLYEFYVRANCGANDYSNWVGPYNFTTQCNVVTEFVEDFESTSGTALPICWSKVGTTGSVNGTGDVVTGFGSLRCLFMASTSASNRGVAAMQTVNNADAGTHQMRLSYRAPVASQIGQTLDLGYLTDPADADTFVTLTTVTVASTSAEELIYSPTGLPSGNVTFSLRCGVENKNLRVDNVYWEPIPSCPYPSALTASNFTPSSANLGWSENGSASNWDIEYGSSGFTPTGVPNIENVQDNPYNLMGLDQGTVYDFYVRADCGSGDESAWVGPYAFSTTCSYYALPYSQDFNNYLPTCWSEGSNTDVATGPNGSDGGWSYGGFLNNPSNTSARFSFSGSNDKDWLVSPTLDFSSGNNGISFNVGATSYVGTSAITMDDDDEVQVLISQDNGSSWTVLQTWNSANTPSNTGDNIIIDLSAYSTSTVKLAFWANEGSTSVNGYNFYIDQLVVDDLSTLSVGENTIQENSLSYYPNPVNNEFTIKTQKNIQEIKIYNTVGQVVKSFSLNMNVTHLDLSQLETGTYFVKVIIDGKPETLRIVKAI